MVSVLQPWLETIPIRMQSTLLLGLRGPDAAAPNVKKITRWLRGLVFKPGNPANAREFMGVMPERIAEKDATHKELEFFPMHYYSHLMHALEVVGYCHPNAGVAARASGLFIDMCTLLHLPPETYDDFYARLRDLPWPGGRQPNNFEEAILCLADSTVSTTRFKPQPQKR